MNKDIIYTIKFKNAFEEIIKKEFYHQQNFQESMLSKIENLKIFPKMYPKIEKQQCRKIPIQKYIVLYRIEEDIIYIINIISTKSNNYNQLYIKYIN